VAVRTACIFAVLIALGGARAADIVFAVPDDGRVTLGVFDGGGRLVRTLHKLSPQEDFRIGLNGLITAWDGKNDAGEAVAPGHYHVRGYLVGDRVRVAGEAFLFNDFAADDGFPGISRLMDFSLLENGDLLLLAAPPSGPPVLARVSEERGFLWTSEIRNPESGPPPVPLLAANSAFAFLLAPDRIAVHSLASGRDVVAANSGAGADALAVAANDTEIFFSSPGGLAAVPLAMRADGSAPAETPWDSGDAAIARPPEAVSATPSAFTSLDAYASALAGASPDGVWIRKEKGEFAKLALPVPVRSIALGTPGTLWFVGEENGSSFVGQATFQGEILRALRPQNDDPQPEKIRASRTAEKFAVIESRPGHWRLRVMARSESGEWTIEWERSVSESANFGFVDGHPAPDAGAAAQAREVRIRLKENPLTGQKDFLAIRAVADPSGSRLVSPDGLPLVEVSSRPNLRRAEIRRGDSPAGIRLLQGDGCFVEEYSITGLDGIVALDAGDVEVP
jgi:prepilin-type processing-associated H-X9-DG protein